jgi:hypothetical protein
MDYESLEKELLKGARNAFETASTLHENQRVEVYLEDGIAKTSQPLDEDEEIIYTPSRILCYQIHGYDYLEDEIKTWIDYARSSQKEEESLAEPTDLEKSILELLENLAKQKGVNKDAISSFEVFANLPITLLGTIEQEILEYWWSAKEQENGMLLAKAQIKEALSNAKFV